MTNDHAQGQGIGRQRYAFRLSTAPRAEELARSERRRKGMLASELDLP